jgi:hypothetical protein
MGTEKILTKQQLQKYFKDYPLIKPSALCIEAGISPDTIYKILKYENRGLTKNISDKLLAVMIKYGYKSTT